MSLPFSRNHNLLEVLSLIGTVFFCSMLLFTCVLTVRKQAVKPVEDPTWVSFDPGMTADAIEVLRGSEADWHLVGVSDADPADANDPVRLGSHLDPDLEGLAAAEPSLVLWPLEAGERVPDGVRAVLDPGAEVVGLPMPRTWAAVLDRTEVLADAFGVEDRRPMPDVELPEAGGLERGPRVLMTMSLRPLRVWGAGSVLHELTASRLDNLASGFAVPAPVVDEEMLLTMDPAVLVLVEVGPEADAVEVVELAGQSWPMVRVVDPGAFLVGLGTAGVAERVVAGVAEAVRERTAEAATPGGSGGGGGSGTRRAAEAVSPMRGERGHGGRTAEAVTPGG